MPRIVQAETASNKFARRRSRTGTQPGVKPVYIGYKIPFRPKHRLPRPRVKAFLHQRRPYSFAQQNPPIVRPPTIKYGQFIRPR